MNYLDKFLDEQEFFRQNSQAKFVVFDVVLNDFINNYMLKMYPEVPVAYLDKIFRDELERSGNSTALTAFLFNRMNIFQINLFKQQQLIQQLQNKIQQLENPS